MDWYVYALIGLYGFVGLGLFVQAVFGRVRDPEGAASGLCFVIASGTTYGLMEWWPLIAGAIGAVVCRALAPSPVDRRAQVGNDAKRWSGASYSQPVLQHMAQHPIEETIEAIRVTYARIPPEMQPIAKQTLDVWYERARREDFGPTSLAQAFTEFVHDARDRLGAHGIRATDQFVFDVFDLMVLQQALAAQTRMAQPAPLAAPEQMPPTAAAA